jgi:hypothetical protein
MRFLGLPVRSIRLQTGIAAALVLHSTLSDIRYQTHEQSGGIAPVNRAIADMDGMTQQNASRSSVRAIRIQRMRRYRIFTPYKCRNRRLESAC